MMDYDYISKCVENLVDLREDKGNSLEEILVHIEDNKLTNDEGFELIKDSSLFIVEYREGHYRPENYSIKYGNDTQKIRSIGDNELSEIANALDCSILEVETMNSNYEVYLGEFVINTWVRILNRELSWRFSTANVELEL